MDYLETIIGKDCCNIINDYKTEIENYDNNIRKIENCLMCDLNYNMYETIFDGEDYGKKYTKLYHKYYLENFTIRYLKEFFCENDIMEYNIMVVFTVNTPEYIDWSEDYIKLNLKELSNEFLLNQKIKFIYKNRRDNICIHLGTYKENNLNLLYESIKKNNIKDFYIFFN